MKTMPTKASKKTNIQKTSKLNNLWGIFDVVTGKLCYIGMSRGEAREYRNSYEDVSGFTGPRKINVTAHLA